MDEAEVGCWKPEHPCGHSQEEGAEEALACQPETGSSASAAG